MKDTAIKLFGKKIALPENGWNPAISGEDSGGYSDGKSCDGRSWAISACLGDKKVSSRTGDEEEQSEEEEREVVAAADEDDDDKDIFEGNPPESKQSGDTSQEQLPESDHDNPKTPSIDDENATAKAPKRENDRTDPNNPQQKPLKKPDKILPCPRCNSMETKFCYYNNYNINQPRHFCKNCQRYWTAGGTMRNVPVGAGRRKNKNSASRFAHAHVTIPEALHGIRIDATNGIYHPNVKPNGTVLSFGPEAPLCESIASIWKLAEKKGSNGGENVDDSSSGSSVTTSNSVAEGARNGFIQEPIMRNLNGFSSQIPCLPGIPFPYPWNTAVAVPAFPPSGFPMPFYPPPPYWNCNVPGAWTVPWFPAPNSQTLGKHTRDGELLKPSNPEGKESEQQRNSGRSVLIPKTLRIDDPDEAVRSSIWSTLGIRNDEYISRGSLFKGFQPKGEKKDHTPETPRALLANPAALSRSLSFQESG